MEKQELLEKLAQLQKSLEDIESARKMVDETVEIFTEKGFKRNTVKEKGNLYFDKH